MQNNKKSALQNFSLSEMYDDTTYVRGRCRLLCKASMAVVLSDMTKDTSCIIYCLASEQPPIQWVSVALPWKRSRGGINLKVKLTSHLQVVLRLRISGSLLPLPQTPPWCVHGWMHCVLFNFSIWMCPHGSTIHNHLCARHYHTDPNSPAKLWTPLPMFHYLSS